ncbi:MAG: ABC transporter ATP-binding protein [Pyrinomonadaceae bacterium]
MKPIIKVENLGKQYKVGSRSTPYTTLRETIHNVVRSPKAILFKPKQNEDDLFWALRDVSFEVMPGEILGIIGSNGAGKSTLLKILARVTEPTRGRVELRGRTNCLLEVGTGFHQELTGRENIFVNGAILGLKKVEIKNLFDEIVAFAEIERFLDTPVKHYSSGMYMRLAFSVAAHLNPDILIIDEVLSVGDAQFQTKSLGKVQDVAESGRTVIFVSHNTAAVENLCRRGVVLREGRVSFVGSQTDAISHYLDDVGTSLGSDLRHNPHRSGSGEIRVTSIEIFDLNGRPLSNVLSGQDIEIHFRYETSPNYSRANVVMGFMVRTSWDVPVFLQHNRLTRDDWDHLPPSGSFVCRIRKLPLPPASYRLGISVMCEGDYLDRVDDAGELNVIEGDFFGSGEVPPITHGCCLVNGEWRLSE